MEFKEHLKKYLDEKTINSLIESFNEKEQKGLFLNFKRISDEKFLELYPKVKPHPYVKHGYLYDKDDYNFGSTLEHDLGMFYIQDPSAMIVSSLLEINDNDIILDMCSAPGGKLIQTSLNLGNKGQIVANDISFSRASILLNNIERLGLDNVTVTCLDFKKIYKSLPNYFSKIILDAPCSGSGMFRKDEKMIKDWTYEKVIKNSYIQKELIDMAIYMLKEGGTLIYSTCSYSFEEDEEIVQYALDNHSDVELIDIPLNNLYKDKVFHKTIHLFPSMFNGEGQYIAKFKKKGSLISKELEPYILTKETKSKGNKSIIETYRLNTRIKDEILKYSTRPGLFISKEYKDSHDIIYEHHYARSLINNPRQVNISLDDTYKFIAGEALNISSKEIHLFPIYNGFSIGYMSNKNNINKNHYPKGLRRSKSSFK